MLKHALATGLLLTVGAAVATADTIGVNVIGGRPGYTSINGTVDGIAGVALQPNWNNIANNGTNTTGGNQNGSAFDLVTGSGAATATDISWTSPNTYASTTGGVTDQDRRLINGYLDNNAGSPTTSVTVTDIPFRSYDVIAYFGSDGDNRTGSVNIDGGTSYYYSTNTAGFASRANYAQTTSTDSGTTPAANYAVFENQSGDSFTLNNVRGNNNTGLHGFQIIERIDSIGLNFVGGDGNNPANGASVAPGSYAGAPEYLQKNWNNLSTDWSGNVGAVPSPLVDSHGDSVGITVGYDAVTTWDTNRPDLATNPNNALMHGYLDSNGAANTGDPNADASQPYVVVDNIPYNVYKVVVYFDGSNGAAQRVGEYWLTDNAGNDLTDHVFARDAGVDFSGAFQEVIDSFTNLGASTPAGNFLVFEGLTSDTFRLMTSEAFDIRVPINAIQIVRMVPAPAALPAGLALMGLAALRRRRMVRR